ncbi:MAG TPA: respiratory nitrate reductase subunit gamma [Spirochaetia bacterium]|nr:respiratory nitrate reductase subunit gamma [Spirochaetia bacterium]
MAAQAVADAVTAASKAAAGASGAVDATTTASIAAGPAGLAVVVNWIDYFIMVPLVYFSILVLVLGVAWRIVSILRAPAQPYSLRLYPAAKRPGAAMLMDTFTMPQVRAHKPLFWVFLMVYHVAFVLLILGHLDILPQINIVAPQSRHMLGGGAVGVAVTLPIFYFIFRRFRSPVREISVPADYLLLLLLLFLFLFGDLMSWGNSWSAHGFVMTKQDFSKYFDGLVRFTFADPRAVLPGAHYHFAVIHVLLADLFFVLLPFTKIIHTFFSVPINMLRRR